MKVLVFLLVFITTTLQSGSGVAAATVRIKAYDATGFLNFSTFQTNNFTLGLRVLLTCDVEGLPEGSEAVHYKWLRSCTGGRCEIQEGDPYYRVASDTLLVDVISVFEQMMYYCDVELWTKQNMSVSNSNTSTPSISVIGTYSPYMSTPTSLLLNNSLITNVQQAREKNGEHRINCTGHGREGQSAELYPVDSLEMIARPIQLLSLSNGQYVCRVESEQPFYISVFLQNSTVLPTPQCQVNTSIGELTFTTPIGSQVERYIVEFECSVRNITFVEKYMSVNASEGTGQVYLATNASCFGGLGQLYGVKVWAVSGPNISGEPAVNCTVVTNSTSATTDLPPSTTAQPTIAKATSPITRSTTSTPVTTTVGQFSEGGETTTILMPVITVMPTTMATTSAMNGSTTSAMNRSATSTITRSTTSAINRTATSTITGNTTSAINGSTTSAINKTATSTITGSTTSAMNRSATSTITRSTTSAINRTATSTITGSTTSTISISTTSPINQTTTSTITESTTSAINGNTTSAMNGSTTSAMNGSTTSTIAGSTTSTLNGSTFQTTAPTNDFFPSASPIGKPSSRSTTIPVLPATETTTPAISRNATSPITASAVLESTTDLSPSASPPVGKPSSGPVADVTVTAVGVGVGLFFLLVVFTAVTTIVLVAVKMRRKASYKLRGDFEMVQNSFYNHIAIMGQGNQMEQTDIDNYYEFPGESDGEEEASTVDGLNSNGSANVAADYAVVDVSEKTEKKTKTGDKSSVQGQYDIPILPGGAALTDGGEGVGESGGAEDGGRQHNAQEPNSKPTPSSFESNPGGAEEKVAYVNVAVQNPMSDSASGK